MAEGSEFTFISSSDAEILKALTLTDDIRKRSDLSSVKTSNNDQIKFSFENDFTFGDGESMSVAINESSADSGLPLSYSNVISAYDHFKFNVEYENVCCDVQSLDLMCESFIQKNQLLEKYINSLMENTLTSSQDILSRTILNERLEQINNVIVHLITVVNQVSRVQQVLEEKPWEKTLKVDPSCQKSVIKFFEIANKIMEKIQEQVEDIGIYRKNKATHVSDTIETELQSKLHNLILGLAKRIDIISRFRDHISVSNQDSDFTASTNSNSEILSYESNYTSDSK